MKKKIGIWINKREAKIVTLKGKSISFHTIPSQIEEFNPLGGSGTRLKGGPQDVIHDSKYLNREIFQRKRFFAGIVNFLSDAGEIVIMGPAQTGSQLHKELLGAYPAIGNVIKSVLRAKPMTDNQLIANVKELLN